VSRSAAQVLEFDQLKEIVGGYTTCVPGRRAIEALAPRQDVVALDAEFVLVGEAAGYLRAGSELGFGAFADPEQWLARLAVPASVLSVAEFLDASSLLEIASSLRQVFKADAAKYPQLAARAATLGDFRHLATAIRRAILPNGEISDEASPQLRRIRTGIAQGRATIRRSLESILRARGETGGVAGGEDYVTLRNDRFVIPVRASDRRGLRYPSDLTNAEWALVEPMIPPAKRGGRRREVNVREVLNAIFYVLSTGCQWQALPKDLPPKSTAHYYFMLWEWDGTLERIHHELYVATREREGREASPSAAIIDSQSAKAAQKGALRSTRRASMRARRSRAASATFSSTRSASC